MESRPHKTRKQKIADRPLKVVKNLLLKKYRRTLEPCGECGLNVVKRI